MHADELSDQSGRDPAMNARAPGNGSRSAVRGILIILHLVSAILFLSDRSTGTNAAVSGFPLDDTWIHMVYGRSLAEHGLPYYNTGEPEAGFTSPLWLVFTATAELAHSLGIAPAHLFLKLLSLLLAMMGSILLFELCLAITESTVPSAFGAGLFAVHPMNAFSQLSGMEVNLTALLITAASLLLILKRHRSAGYAFAAAYLARPETIVFVPVAFIISLFTGQSNVIKDRLFPGRLATALVGPAIIAGLAWMTYCLAVNGHPLPNTFYVKYETGGMLPGMGRAIREFLREMTPFKWGAGIILYIFGLAMLIRRRELSGILVGLFPWIYVMATGISRSLPQGSGSYFYWWRYWAPGMSLLAIPLARGAAVLWDSRAGISGIVRNHYWRFHGSRILLILICLVMLGPYVKDLPRFSRTFAWNCRNINEVQVAIGRWVDENAGRDEAVLVNDAGAIRYFGKRKTIDLFGLNNHEILFSPSRGKEYRTDAAELGNLALRNNARYLIIFPPWFRRLIQSDEFKTFFDPLYFFESTNYTVTPGEAQSRMFIFTRKLS